MRDAVPSTTPPSDSAPQRRVWTTPLLKKLPKLTDLTLASPIGGGGGTGGGGSTVFGILLAALTLVGCSADRGTAPSDALPAPVKMQAVTCRVSLAGSQVDCAGPQRVGGREILGGQGEYVALRSSNVAAAAGLFSADVTVQNLTAQPLGTDDGVNTSGVYVFFLSGPTVTGGTGAVTVANADGMSNFTTPGQLYFAYDTILGGLEESAPVTWEWNYDPTVTDFTFTVMVAADVPEVGGVLRWAPVEAMTPFDIDAIAANSTSDVIALGDGSHFYRKGGATWGSQPFPLDGYVPTVKPLGAGQYVAISSTWPDSRVTRFAGSQWTTMRTISVVELIAVYAGGTNDIAVGGYDYSASGAYLSTFDGTDWHDTTLVGLSDVIAIGGTGPGNLVAATRDGDLLQWDGTEWAVVVPAPGIDNRVRAIQVTGPGAFIYAGSVDRGGFDEDGFVASFDGVTVDTILLSGQGAVYSLHNTGGGHFLAQVAGNAIFSGWTLMREWDGASWTTLDSLGTVFSPMVSDGSTGYYLLGSDGMYRWTTGGLTSELTGLGENFEYNAVATAGDSVYIANEAGEVVTYDGTAWTAAGVSGDRLEALWAFSSTDIYAAGPEGAFHYDGTGWDPVPLSEIGADVRKMWGSGSTLYAAKSDTVFVRSGGVWTAHGGVGGGNYFRDIWGTGPNDVYFVGYPYGLTYFNGTSWFDAPLAPRTPGDSSFQLTGIGGTAMNDVWIGTDMGIVLHYDGVTSTEYPVPDISTAGGVLANGSGQTMVCGDGVYLGTTAGLRRISHPGVRCDVGLVRTTDGKLWAVGAGSVYVATR